MRTKKKLSLAALGAVVLLTLTACGASSAEPEPTGPGDSGESGVPFGASKEEYQAAFEDIEPITIIGQTVAAQGSILGLKEEAYFAAVEEWSGGKITFDIGYAYAYAGVTEIHDAISEGRLDLGTMSTGVTPAEFPTYSAVSNLTFMSPTGAAVYPLQSNAYMQELTFETPGFVEEFEAQGLHVLVPFMNIGAAAPACREDLTDFHNRIAAAGGAGVSTQLEGLGFGITGLVPNELYEGLQRGTLDCGVIAPLALVGFGVLDVAPYLFVPQETSFAVGGGSLVIGKEKWDSLPLVAQQLLSDRLDVYYGAVIDTYWESAAQAIDQAEAARGGLRFLTDEQDAELAEASDALLDNVRASDHIDDPEQVIGLAEDLSAKWRTFVESDMGVDPEITFADVAQWAEKNGAEARDALLEELWKEVFIPRRPGGE